MKRTLSAIVVASVLFLAGCGSGGGSDGGGGPGTDACHLLAERIINGSRCEEEGSPVVALNVTYRRGDPSLCSGTVITPTHVLTAAHCFRDGEANVRDVVVQAGSVAIAAAGIEIDPRFRRTTSADFFDLAVVELSQPIPIAPVPILVSESVEPGQLIGIFGYGLDEDGGIGLLRSGEMVVSTITSDHIGAAFSGEGSNTCNGDSGGPAILQVLSADGELRTGLVGVISTGDPATLCRAGDFSLFANLQSTPYLDFVREQAPGVVIE